MNTFLVQRPKGFSSVPDAIKWQYVLVEALNFVVSETPGSHAFLLFAVCRPTPCAILTRLECPVPPSFGRAQRKSKRSQDIRSSSEPICVKPSHVGQVSAADPRRILHPHWHNSLTSNAFLKPYYQAGSTTCQRSS